MGPAQDTTREYTFEAATYIRGERSSVGALWQKLAPALALTPPLSPKTVSDTKNSIPGRGLTAPVAASNVHPKVAIYTTQSRLAIGDTNNSSHPSFSSPPPPRPQLLPPPLTPSASTSTAFHEKKREGRRCR